MLKLHQPGILSLILPATPVASMPPAHRPNERFFQSADFDIVFNQNFCDSSELTFKVDYKTWQVGDEKNNKN